MPVPTAPGQGNDGDSLVRSEEELRGEALKQNYVLFLENVYPI